MISVTLAKNLNDFALTVVYMDMAALVRRISATNHIGSNTARKMMRSTTAGEAQPMGLETNMKAIAKDGKNKVN